jgi:hypothetical protein
MDPDRVSVFSMRRVPVDPEASYPYTRTSMGPVPLGLASVTVPVEVPAKEAVCVPKLSLLVATSPFVGPVPEALASMARVVRVTEHPAAGVTVNV